jgi:nitrile hydratase beta subunit-like protein
MARTHDMGGRPTDEPLNTAEHALADWEVLSDAVAIALGAKGIRRTDESRRAMEDMPADDYLALSYYERWAHATETLLTEKNILSREEIDRKMAALAETWDIS